MNSSASTASATSARGSARHDPRQLQLREAAALRKAAEGEGQAGFPCGERLRVLVRGQREVEEHFVDDQGDRGTVRAVAQSLGGRGIDPGAGGVVRVHEEGGARTHRDPGLGGAGLPPAVRVERKAGGAHALERRQVLEERVGRRGHEHRVAGIAEELEQEAVRLARRRGDDDPFGIDLDPARGVLARHRLARAANPLGIRPVVKPGGGRAADPRARAGRRSRTGSDC